jgi:hypothetical protein
MRTIAILPIAAAALAAGAIGAWGLGLASSRAVLPDLKQAATVCSPATAATASGQQARATVVASIRYRAEACSGDYVCGDDGAWEVVAAPAVLPAIHQ